MPKFTWVKLLSEGSVVTRFLIVQNLLVTTIYKKIIFDIYPVLWGRRCQKEISKVSPVIDHISWIIIRIAGGWESGYRAASCSEWEEEVSWEGTVRQRGQCHTVFIGINNVNNIGHWCLTRLEASKILWNIFLWCSNNLW